MNQLISSCKQILNALIGEKQAPWRPRDAQPGAELTVGFRLLRLMNKPGTNPSDRLLLGQTFLQPIKEALSEDELSLFCHV